MRNRDNISDIPFLKILPLVIIGIVIGNWVQINNIILSCLSALFLIASFLFRKRDISSIFISLSICLFAMLISSITLHKEIVPKGEKITCLTTIESTPYTHGRWQQCDARITLFNPSASKEWHETNERIILRVDTCINITAGDIMFAKTYLNPFSESTGSDYAKLMRRRGFSGSCFITADNNVQRLDSKAKNIRILSARIQSFFIERFQRLSLSEKAEAVCMAMTFGNKQMLASEDKENYAHSGTAHILAVSGLHVGIIAMIVNWLLFFTPFIRRGHLLKNIMAIISILFFALMTGMSPSVVRAAFMFCGFQIALATSSHYNKINILLATATMMLLFNPNYLYDISFQLSFIAVTGIILLYQPLYRTIRCRFAIVNQLNGLALVSIIATVVTAPIIAAQFGRLTIWGIVINPIIMLTSTIIITLSFLYALLPFSFLTTPISFILDNVATLQNNLAEFCSNLSWGSWSVDLHAVSAIAIYLTAIAGLFVVLKIKSNKTEKLNINQ